MSTSTEYAFIAKLEARGHWGIKRGLDNIRALLEALGYPDRSYPVLLIAGTNGKGSVGAMLHAMLSRAGHRVGWTTSPHLISVTERIRIGEQILTGAQLDSLLAEVFSAEESLGIQATYFELMIAAALLGFRQASVELALVEVGLGGRWDATNATEPILTVLTNVAMDHQTHLGNTLEAIAREKLCTARDGRPLVLGPGLDAEWIHSLLECRPRLCQALPFKAELISWDHSVVDGHWVNLAGAHQLENLATAAEVIRQLRDLYVSISDEALWQGVAHVSWPGRLWKVPGFSNLWLDGAHNPDGARVLADHAITCGLHPHVFFGAMRDKDVSAMALELKRMNPRSITFVQGDDARYADGEQLRVAWDLDLPVLTLSEGVAQLRESNPDISLVTGSLYLLGDLLRVLGIRPSYTKLRSIV